MPDQSTRTYTSPLRERRARETQDRILDALTDLLKDRRTDDVTTREIAERAGVSQPTVYRHFPDREALLAGLAARLATRTGSASRLPTARSVDDFGADIAAMFLTAEEFAVEATAEALLNADPRRFAPDTARHSDVLRGLVAAEFSHLDEDSQRALTALLRCLGSAQTWLRMREEFGVPGTESGPLVQWAIDVLLTEAKRGLPSGA